jgi:cob(I)alamin adenosyltransferase
MKIYTRGGDSGDTSLFDGTRVPKSDARVDAYGEVDELNAALGAARAAGLDADLAEMIERVQRDLFALGARLADPARRIATRVDKASVAAFDAPRLEAWIDALEPELPPLRRFILPGGSPAGAALHQTRTICRRAERRVAALPAGSVEPEVLVYLNRLSDFLFVVARVVNHRAGAAEIEW